ncbi:MAG: hypothetical protein DRP06_04325 [Candidatus Aenigmatarchaeota archaeon]|nr:MAG: hypothetical protein DRP06_04325 [Candidatus Aenigmarchaeota archaeon]
MFLDLSRKEITIREINQYTNEILVIRLLYYIMLIIGKFEKRKERLEELKDEILVYNDEESKDSINRGLKYLKEGRFKRCESSGNIKKLFEGIFS